MRTHTPDRAESRCLGLEYGDDIDPIGDAELRVRVVALLEQHGIATVAALAPIFEHGNKHLYRADLVDGHAVVVRVFPHG